MMMEVVDLRNNLKNLEDKQAYVKWWAKKSELNLILDKLNVNFDDIKDSLDIKDDLYCIYLGSSNEREISGYLNFQLNDKHTKSTMNSGLSTFRRSVSSIVSTNQADGEGTDEFLNKLKIEINYIDFPVRSPEAKSEIERIVTESLEKNLYLLNINGNNHPLSNNITKNLRKLRKESLNNAKEYFSSNDENDLNNIDVKKTEKIVAGDNNMWLIAAGRESAKYNVFKKHNFVAIGWDLGDLSGKNEEYIKNRYAEVFGEFKKYDITQINNFVNEIEIGDYIITSSKDTRSYLIGKCTSDYFYSDKLDDNNDVDSYYYNCRHVDWYGEIGWEDLCTEAKNFVKQLSVRNVKKSIKEEFLTFIPFVEKENRNQIYFGAPGTGKSYNLNSDKDELLTDFVGNYERVTFHPDYTYANFVGTYRPVVKNTDEEDSISYKYVPGPFIRTLVNALKNPYEPFLLIIEEINRANVAAVFGEVFQLLDRDGFKNSQYHISVSEDINNHLIKELDISEISEDKREIISKYWKFLLGKHFEKMSIPNNMFIWATMNSADQGVFPMDTAFKRRWDFKYFSINHDEDLIANTHTILNNKSINWNTLRKQINDELLSYKVNEDKLMGPFFAFNEFMNQEIPEDIFKDTFKNKIIMYLFEDAAKPRRNDLFSGAKTKDYVTYSQICEMFDEKGLEIFCDNIKNRFLDEDEED